MSECSITDQEILTEEWRPVVGFNGLYEVSSLGRLAALARIGKGSRGQPRMWPRLIRKPQTRQLPGRCPYHCLMLSKDGRAHHRDIHRMVVEAFIGIIPPTMQVNHKDGNGINNRLSNLEIVTQSENIKHRIHVLGQRKTLFSSTHRQRTPSAEGVGRSGRLTNEIVREIRKSTEDDDALSRLYGVGKNAIGRARRGKTWKNVT